MESWESVKARLDAWLRGDLIPADFVYADIRAALKRVEEQQKQIDTECCGKCHEKARYWREEGLKLRQRVEELEQTAARIASEAACERLRAEAAEAEVERLKQGIADDTTEWRRQQRVAEAENARLRAGLADENVLRLKAEAEVAREALGLRDRVLAMMKARGWGTDWIHRSAYLHLECAELAEAVRGKRGSTLDESGDVLITLLALSPHTLAEIIEAATAKVADLEVRPAYPGETRAALRGGGE